MRLLSLAALVATLALALAGCSAFGDGDSGLAPGTFRFHADGRTYTGTATYYPNTDRPLAEATISLTEGDMTVLSLSTDDLRDVRSSERVLVLASFRSPSGFSHRSREARLRATKIKEGIEGRFQFRLKETGNGPIQLSDTTADGAFYATLAQEE